MKRFLIVGLLFISICFLGQKTVAQSTTLTPGSILPNMTTAQRTAVVSPPNGMLVFDSNTQSYWFRQSGAWVELPKGGSTSNYWELSGLAGNELKNTNSGGFWSESANRVSNNATDINYPPTAPVNGPGTRLMWISNRSAFRVGTVHGNYWDADSIGLFSVALGENTKARGRNSTAMGDNTEAIGYKSTAIGTNSTAFGAYSTSIGISTKASGNWSTAFGESTTASGQGATAMGGFSTASGQNSTAIGYSTLASGIRSTTFGQNTTASGINSSAAGWGTIAKANSSFSIGSFNENSDNPALWTLKKSDRIFQIGNGESNDSRSNTLTILRDGRMGINNITSPDAMLHIKGIPNIGSKIKLELNDPSTDYAEIFAYPNTLQLTSPGTGRFLFVSQNGGVKALLNSLGYLALARSGNDARAPLHIGEFGPDTWERHIRLDFNASTNQYGNIVYDSEGMKFRTWGDGDDFYFRNSANTSVARINDTGNMTIAGTLTQNSDRRLKTNLTKVQNSGNRLAQLQAYHYNWKAADSDPSLQTGLIAQEVQKQFPELVYEGENGYLSVNYIGLIPHLIESHKELKAENEELKRRLLIIEKSLKMETQTASSK